jgi:sarcosine oxidase
VTERYDAVVVGAGAMGSAAAWWLARRGRRVALVDRFEAGHTRGSSHGASRIFRYAYADPVMVRLVIEARPLWDELQDDAGETLLDEIGALDHGDPATVDLLAAAMAAGGVTFERLRPEAAAERWPHLRFEGVVVHQPTAGRCLADATVAALLRRAEAHGADVRCGMGPATVDLDGDGVRVEAGGEELEAATAVVTAGGWVGSVVGPETSAALPLPALRVTEEQLVHFPPTVERDEWERWASVIHHADRFWYALPSPGTGLKVGGHHEGDVIDPDRRRDGPDPDYVDGLARYVEAWIPGVRPEPTAGTTCLYTTTPDERFLVDRRGPIVVGSACSGHGFKFVPLVGRVLADLVDGLEPEGPFRRLADAS